MLLWTEYTAGDTVIDFFAAVYAVVTYKCV